MKWISVRDGLPKENGDYLVYFQPPQKAPFISGEYYDDGWCSEFVTHWMQLPEPPKEDK